MDIDQISGRIVDAAMKVHSALGPELLESAYEASLLYELQQRGLKAVAQVELLVAGTRPTTSCPHLTSLLLRQKGHLGGLDGHSPSWRREFSLPSPFWGLSSHP